MTLELRVATVLWALYMVWVMGVGSRTQEPRHLGVTLKGTLYQRGDLENCQFFTDPANDSLSVNISADPGQYLCDYLAGSVTHQVTIRIEPEPK